MRPTLALLMAPRRRAPRPILLVIGALVLATGSFAWMVGAPSNEPAPQAGAADLLPVPGADPVQPLSTVDSAIATWTTNLERDHADFIAATHLADLYLARARLTADPADLDRALAATEAALAANPQLVSAALLQAQVHLARHQFSAARAGSLAVLEAHPRLAAALATLGDAQLELGAYDEAAATYAGLASTTNVPAVTARLARLAALTGALSKGRRLAGEAIEVVAADPDAAATDLAWYHTLAGSLAFQAGDLPGAAAAYRAALDAWPGSAAALAGLGRTLAASGETEAAIATYQRSVAIVPGPDAVAALGDLLTVAGRAAEAEAAHAQLDAVATLAAAAGLHDRQLALFLANHGRDPARAVDVARADLARRGDVYAHDALAWALYAAGDLDAAAAQAAAARALGTEDALLDYHAGMIAAARGDEAEARALLAAALDRNPAFDPLQAPRAAAALAALGGPVR